MPHKVGPYKVSHFKPNRTSAERFRSAEAKKDKAKLSHPISNNLASDELSAEQKQRIRRKVKRERLWGKVKVLAVGFVLIAAAYFAYNYYFPDGYQLSGMHPHFQHSP